MRSCIIRDGLVVNVIVGTMAPGDGETVVQNNTAAIGWSYDGNEFHPPEANLAAPNARAVDEERNRRLALGFDYDFGDERGIHHFGTREADMVGWDEVTTLAQALINVGAGATAIGIDTDTAPVSLTANEWQQVLLASAQQRQPIWSASFTLKAMDPIPADYASNNAYWTA